jgi:hypothetical protein
LLLKTLMRLGLFLALLLLVLFGGLVVLTQGSGGGFPVGRDDLMGQWYWLDKNTVVPRN